MRLFFFLLLVPSLVFAQVLPPSGGGGGGSYTPGADDHAGQDMSANSIVLTDTSGGPAVTIGQGSLLCLDEDCFQNLKSEGNGVTFSSDISVYSIDLKDNMSNSLSGVPVKLQDPDGVAFDCRDILSECDGAGVPQGTMQLLCSDYSIHVCTNMGWVSLESKVKSVVQSVSFEEMPTQQCQDSLVTISDVNYDTSITSTGCGEVESYNTSLQCSVNSAIGGVRIRVCCHNSVAGCGTPPSTDFTIKVMR